MQRGASRAAVAAIGAALALVGAAATSSGAATAAAAGGTTAATVSDPRDTATPLDIKTATVGGGASAVFGVATWDPFADAQADFTWTLDVDGDGNADDQVMVSWNGTALHATVFPLGTDPGGPATVRRTSPTSLDVTFARSEIGGAGSFAWMIQSWFDTNGDGVRQPNEVDTAPDGAGFGFGPAVERLAGADRVETAIAVSRDGFADASASAVVLARADGFADALSGAPLAGAKGGPLLLNPNGALDGRVEAEIRRVLPSQGTVYLLGGDGALSDAVESRLRSLGFGVTRFAGVDRYDTAIQVAHVGLGDPAPLFVTNGADFPDALSAGAAAVLGRGALVLTDGTTMPRSVREYLDAHPGQRYAVGGPAATADRSAIAIVGADRYDTARVVAQTFFTNPSFVGIASGETFADAVAGAAHAPLFGGPLLLTAARSLSPPAHDYLVAVKRSIRAAGLYGGTAALDTTVEQAVRVALA